MKVTIYGSGYVGLVTGTCLAEVGNDVLCVDIDARKTESELSWRPSETFETGIRKTVQWYLDNQTWVGHVVSGEYQGWLDKQYGGGHA